MTDEFKAFWKIAFLICALWIGIGFVLVSLWGCDTAPTVGRWLPSVEARDLSGFDAPSACWLEEGVYPCLDGGVDGGAP